MIMRKRHLRRDMTMTAVAGIGVPRCAALIAALLLALFLVGGANRGTAQEVSIKVLVNDDPISDYDIDQRTRFLAITEQSQPSPELKQKAIDMLIDERLQMQEGRRQGITPDDDDVNKILGDMAKKNNLDVDGLATALGKTGVNIKTLKDRIRSQLVWQETVRKKFRRDVQIGDADITAAMTESATEEGGAAAAPAESTLQLRQVKFEIPAGADQGTIAARLAAAENSARPIRKLRRSRQGRGGCQREDALGREALFSRPARAAPRDQCQDRANDAPHHLGGGRRALRRVRQALVQGRRGGPYGDPAQIDE